MKMTILDSSKSTRHSRTAALGDVAARNQQQLEAVGVAVSGGHAHRTPTEVVARGLITFHLWRLLHQHLPQQHGQHGIPAISLCPQHDIIIVSIQSPQLHTPSQGRG